MKNKLLNRFLALDRKVIIDALNASTQIKDFWKALPFGRELRRGRGYEEFEKAFNINLLDATKKNAAKKKEQEK